MMEYQYLNLILKVQRSKMKQVHISIIIQQDVPYHPFPRGNSRDEFEKFMTSRSILEARIGGRMCVCLARGK